MPAELSEAACCRNCDYLLCGLPSNICPECGHGKWLRPFDFKRRTVREVMKESLARLLDIGRAS